MSRSRSLGATALLIATMQFGCRATILKPTEADKSRREAQRLTGEVQSLESRIAQLEAELAVARRDRPDPLPEALPIPVRLELGRLSGAVLTTRSRDAEAPPESTLVRLYLQPLDGRGRFAHPLGDLDVELLGWRPQGDPVLIGRLHLTPAELSDAFRSGLTGTHYTIEIPISPPLTSDQSLIVRCRLQDELTGRTTTLERVLPARTGSR